MAKEERIRAITQLYYSNPKVQEAIVEFAKNREVVPRYFENFGKRPDMIQYPSDVLGLVKKGATSFHASEEIWNDPLQISAEMNIKELNELRKGWDLLIDIDSPFLDCSKIAAKLIAEALEHHGVKNYGIKFSGSKGFHIIVSGKAFPEEFGGKKTKEMFPEWARAICGYLMSYIRKDYNKLAGEIMTNFDAIEKRTKLSESELKEVHCVNCNRAAKKGIIAMFRCDACGMKVERRNHKTTKRRLKCLSNDCAGVLVPLEQKEYFYCDYCVEPKNEKIALSSDRHPEMFEKVVGVSAEKIANLDLVLVAPRHLFRMPYSLHEKTALASIVLNKDEIENFSPKDADAMKIKIKKFLPENEAGEARKLLNEALDWQKTQKTQEEKAEKKIYANYKFDDVKIENVSEEMFPKPIKKLLKGLEEGKKRGLFILLTFLKCVNFSPEKINEIVKEWNGKNSPPLREGYVRSQIEWHLRQKRKILPPNYDHASFYKDIGLIDEKPKAKNPLVEVLRNLRKSQKDF